jgi:ATP-dependent exoDNAse (exonuclease V) alpha subunit
LSLDVVQIDVRDWFMTRPAMAYVALSRGRTPENIWIVGTPAQLKKAATVDPDTVPYV